MIARTTRSARQSGDEASHGRRHIGYIDQNIWAVLLFRNPHDQEDEQRGRASWSTAHHAE